MVCLVLLWFVLEQVQHRFVHRIQALVHRLRISLAIMLVKLPNKNPLLFLHVLNEEPSKSIFSLSLLVLITPVAHTFVYISLSRFSILHTLSFSFEQANKINATFLSHVLRLFWCYLLPFLLSSSSSSSSCFSCAILFFYDLIV